MEWTNPVWPGSMPDPFVLRTTEGWFAYGTGPAPGATGLQFPVLHSDDLARWAYVGGALEPLGDPAARAYWAPEVCLAGGRYVMYYSAGGPAGEGHRLRAAEASRPGGPFRDAGRVLLPDEPFTIDAHPFQDPADGAWYLFFARDYLDGRAGTGTAVVRLSRDMLGVEGAVYPVVRATADWQVYERNRAWLGRTWDAWHTVEGPAVLARDGRYWCLTSGGCWQGPDYGVSSAVADCVTGPYREVPGASGPSVLRGTAEAPGPGHCSVVVGPDGITQWVAYHAWDPARTARRMHLDPLVWTPQGPRCLGPTVGARSWSGP